MALHRPLAPQGRATLGAGPAGAPCAVQARPCVVAAAILASTMAFIDSSVVTIALPVLQAHFQANLAALQWVVNGYMLFLGALILVGCAAGDRFGRRRLFLIGTLAFVAASAACALAPSVGWLIAARAAQAIGAALMTPQSFAILSASFLSEIRGRAIGAWASASVIATALATAAGGFLIDALGWRAAFWINLPIAAAVIWFSLRNVPERRGETTAPLDWAGAALAVASAALLTLGLTAFAERGADLTVAGLVLAGRAAGAPRPLHLARLHWREPHDALPLRRALGHPLSVTVRPDGSSRHVGERGRAGLVAARSDNGLFARRAGALADRIGVRAPLTAGSLLVAASGFALALDPPGLVGVLGPVLLLASGMALVVAPLTTAVMNAAPDAGRRRLRRLQRREPPRRPFRRRAYRRGRHARLRRRPPAGER